MPQAVTETADIQALVHSGLASLTEAEFWLCRIKSPVAARTFLRAAPVTTVADLASHQTTALQVALSVDGMRALGVSEAVVSGFSPEFVEGMAGDPSRSRRIGDVGPSAPETWAWGYPRAPDLVVMLYAELGGLNGLRQQITALAGDAFEVTVLPTSDMGGHEPFGFVDGVSQPSIDWKGHRSPGTPDDLEFGNLITAGEFLLGYENEYQRFTARPTIAANAQADAPLPPAADDPTQSDVGRNGAYLVFRQLRQDVRSFWRFAQDRAGPAGAQGLAEAMVGRKISGDPLEAVSATPIAGVGSTKTALTQNNFTFGADPDGQACPLGAHIRRANPRTADMPGGKGDVISRILRMLGWTKQNPRADALSASRFHRILRRGREYGERADPSTLMHEGAPDPVCGLNFLCLNANIARQFEFVQGAWLMSAKFDGLSGEQDALLGNRQPLPANEATCGFSLPSAAGPARQFGALPQFVTVVGGAYFFLPGVRALRFMAREDATRAPPPPS
jgi:deferrochelatase/peroxidase EfeB